MNRLAGSDDLWAISLRVMDMRKAMIDVSVMPDWLPRRSPEWRGPEAPPRPSQVAKLAGSFTTMPFVSKALGETRTLTVYVPPLPSGAADLPVVYLADGGSREFARIAEALIVAGHIPPVVLVGIASGRGGERACAPRCDRRSQEYLIDIPEANAAETARFEQHQRFVTEEILPYIEQRYPVARTPERRATAGFSSGAAWALTMAGLYPQTFGNVMAFSLGWKPAAERAAAAKHARIFLGAGTLEGRFVRRTTEAAATAEAAKARAVKLRMHVGGHSMAVWEQLFAEGLPWLFGDERRQANVGGLKVRSNSSQPRL